MSSKWRKVKLALGLNLGVYAPPEQTTVDNCSGDALLSPASSTSPSRWSRSFSRSPKLCIIIGVRPKNGTAVSSYSKNGTLAFNLPKMQLSGGEEEAIYNNNTQSNTQSQMDKGKRPWLPQGSSVRTVNKRNRAEEEAEKMKKLEWEKKKFEGKMRSLRNREDKKGKDWVPTKEEYDDFFGMNHEDFEKQFKEEQKIAEDYRKKKITSDEFDAQMKMSDDFWKDVRNTRDELDAETYRGQF